MLVAFIVALVLGTGCGVFGLWANGERVRLEREARERWESIVYGGTGAGLRRTREIVTQATRDHARKIKGRK